MADAFIGVFRTSADVFVSLTTGIIPLIVVFLTAVNALVKFIGEDKVENFAKWAAQEVWMGVPVGDTIVPFELVTPLAVRYLLAGLVVILIRGVTTDIIYSIMSSRKVGAE